MSTKQPTKEATRDRYGRALVDLGHRDHRVVVLDADLSKSTKTALFADAYPERFFNLGIAEANMIGVAAGLACTGKIVFVSTFAIFATQRALNQIFQSVAYTGLNVKICATHAGITVGEDGATHQALDDIALMRAMPGMKVVVPADAEEAYQATLAVARYDGPVYLRLGRLATSVITSDEEPFTIGRAKIMRPGRDITLAACGFMVEQSLRAAEKLAEEGIDAEVINVSTIKPLDTETLVQSAARTGVVVTVEEHSVIGGLGGAVAEALASHHPVPVHRVGVPDLFGQSGDAAALLTHYGLTPENICDTVRQILTDGKERKK